MVLFGGQSSSDQGEYAPVMEDENKPLSLRHPEEETAQQLTQHEIYALTRSLKRTNLFLKIIIGLLCFTLIALLSINVPNQVKEMIKTVTCDTVTCEAGSLIKTPVPSLHTEKVTFKKDPIYSQRPSEDSDKAWDALLPDGRGFVYIPDWEKYDLPLGQNTSYGMIYSTAVFHQLHCLGQLRRFSFMFMDSIIEEDKDKMEEIKYMFGQMSHGTHLLHCFDYLRQSIQCAGDMAMEWPRTETDGSRYAVDGWDIPHECKSWVS
jgi:hypothetical protein